MTIEEETNRLFFSTLDKEAAKKTVTETLSGCDDGELFLEYAYSEHLVLDDGRIKSSGYNASSGFGLRAISAEAYAYALSNEISEHRLKEAAASVRPIKSSSSKSAYLPVLGTSTPLYTDQNPLSLVSFEQKVDLMGKIDAYARSKDSRVSQVSASLGGEWQVVKIIDADGREASDIRPLVRFNVSIVAKQNGRMESGSYGLGGRYLYDSFFKENVWKFAVDEALRQALVNLESVPAPAGEFPVVLSSGWCGVLLHEAVGHGLEGDFNRKGSSVFTGKIGEQVTAKGITVVDDGTLPNLRGSISIDDEGTPSQRTVLIEDGILKNYMQDRMNARLMNASPTGNGRRESFAAVPQVRMTNTFMTNGDKAKEELIASVKKGVYAKSFHGGQVDITSGKFVFTSSEAYLIENGKITAPLKDATLIGNGIDVMNAIDMIADDSCLDNGIGTCGKGGQSVPVGVGQPSVRISKITVGGR